MKPFIKDWDIYDPDVGDDRVLDLGDGRIFSSRSAGMVVLEGPNTDWTAHVKELNSLFTNARGTGFFTFVPWVRATDERLLQLRSRFPTAETVDDTIFIAGGLGLEGFVNHVVDVKKEVGAGVWSFGVGAVDVVSALRSQRVLLDSPVLTIAAVSQYVDCAVCNEDGVDFIFSRAEYSREMTIRSLAERLGAMRPSSRR